MDTEQEQTLEQQKSDMAKKQLRDQYGHFVRADGSIHTPTPPPTSSNPISSFLKEATTISKTTNDNTLIDIHVGNPLRKIALLLEEIKKQKAFTFDFKGSLGVAGILLVLTTFGIFGGTQAFCSKGEQSHIGTLAMLTLPPEQPDTTLISTIKTLWNIAVGNPSKTTEDTARIVLIEQNQTIYRLLGLDNNHQFTANTQYIATGEVNTCSQTITIKSPKAIQPHQ
jgi:hypothetical protein